MNADPGDLQNEYDVVNADVTAKRRPRKNAATAASAAGVRAFASQAVAFYFRAPIKAFFRTRIDYLAYARAINPRVRAGEAYSLRTSSIGVLAHAIKTHGWSFIPNQILPPMIANVTVGAILYTTYLTSLGVTHTPSSHGLSRVYPPPSVHATFKAGFVAGAVQSVAAAPLDALQVRFQARDMLGGKYGNMMHYGREKLKEIGLRGIFAGWSLSLVKDSLGYGLFFASFETVKSQGFYWFVTQYYGRYKPYLTDSDVYWIDEKTGRKTIKPHFAMEPSFILLAGVVASVTSQFVQLPIQTVQNVHFKRLEFIDHEVKNDPARGRMLRLYYRAYEKTFEECRMLATKAGGWRNWLFKDLVMNTLRQTPSTSAGLIVFEMVRRRYATDADIVRIKKDGYDILLA